MLELFGKNYYIDVNKIIEECRPVYSTKKVKTKKTGEGDSTSDDTSLELNVFKFEIFKACVERAFNEYQEEADEKLAGYAENSATISFKIAFNTLLKYEILKEDYE
jgi:hypothetical protein